MEIAASNVFGSHIEHSFPFSVAADYKYVVFAVERMSETRFVLIGKAFVVCCP